MKVGVLTNILRDRSFDDALAYFSSIGYEMITIGAGGLENLDEDHCDAKKLLANPDELKKFADTVKKHNLEISTIACPANTLHPQKAIAQSMDEDLRNCVLLAEKLGLDRISTFSGCPGDCETATYPNWVTYGWPYDFAHILEWQPGRGCRHC